MSRTRTKATVLLCYFTKTLNDYVNVVKPVMLCFYLRFPGRSLCRSFSSVDSAPGSKLCSRISVKIRADLISL